MSGSYVVLIHYPGQPPQPREFSQARVVVGREAGDIILADSACSSTHAELLFDGHGVRVRDLGSTNGTWLNGQRIGEIFWTRGATLHIGGHRLTLEEVRVAGPARGRTAVVSAVPGGIPPTVPGGPAGGQVPQYGPAHAVPAYGPPPGYGAPTAGAHGFHPGPHAAARSAKDAKKGSSNALWVILGMLFIGALGVAAIFLVALAGRKDGGASVAASGPMKEAREATVKFVWFAGKEGPTAKGGASPERIRVGPNSSRVVSVGISEEFAGGSGNQWRTATWLAAFNASRAVGGSLVDYDFNVHVGGLTDGPSAGMLTTVSMIALMRGVTPRPDTTMTGTINPDGTAGPVSGIVQKMQGAREAGLKRFGFPIGTRSHKDLRTGATVDLLTVAQSLGLEARELSDVYEAYAFMTNDKLPRVDPVAEAEMEPNGQIRALLQTKLLVWKTRVDTELVALKAETAKAGAAAFKTTKTFLDDGQAAYDAAQRYEKLGVLAPALENYALSVVYISVARRFTNAAVLARTNNLGGLVKALNDASAVNGDIKTFTEELEKKAQFQTRGGQVAATSGFTAAARASAAARAADRFAAQAQAMLKSVQGGKQRLDNETREQLLTSLLIPLLYYDTARTALDYAKDVQALIVEEGTARPMDGATLERTVAGYASASAAVFAYLDALVADQFVDDAGVSAEQSRALFAQFEIEYELGRELNAISERSPSRGATIGAKLLRLSSASDAFLTGAKLVNKYYSLGGRPNKEGKFELENRRALAAQMDLARLSAREAAARAKARIGFVPAAARVAFQSANAQREGSDDEKLKALAEYWRSTFFSELGGG
ncbi:MAG TPA: FHA domain-containing protein [Polyangiaceae bacterium]